VTISEATTEIESLPFAVRVGLANSFRTFLRNISSEQVVRDLLGRADSRAVGMQLMQRVSSLSTLSVDLRYLHRYDISLATYLWILSRTVPELAAAGAEATAAVPRTWWAEQVARYILDGAATRSDTGSDIQLGYGTQNLSSSNVASSTAQFVPSTTFGFVAPQRSLTVASSGTQTSVVQQSSATQSEALAFDTAQPLQTKSAEKP
jgi:hypothetical protein